MVRRADRFLYQDLHKRQVCRILYSSESYGASCPPIQCPGIVPGCTKNCTCYHSLYYGGSMVSCDDREIKNIPRIQIQSLPNDTVSLSLRGNKLQVIAKEAFQGLTSLKNLYLDRNEIEVIEDGAFSNLSSLTDLYLRWNELQVIAKEAFQGLTSLKTLSLEDNNLQEIAKAAFEGLTSLETLQLSGNKLQVIAKEAFQGLTSLKTLILERNKLQVIAKEAFQGLTSLKTLDLDGNEIEVIEDGAFNNLSSLTRLELKNNRLQEIAKDTFQGLQTLTTLQLNYNPLQEIAKDAFQGQKSLETLGLTGIVLQEVTKDVFHGLKSLIYLIMMKGKVRTIENGAFKNVINLEELNLEENEISMIHKGAFQNLWSLQTLRLDQNKLTFVGQGLFVNLTSLTLLQLGSNKISYIEDQAFKNLSKLQYLGLFDNQLLAINAYTLEGLKSLVYLDAANNPLRVINNRAFHGTPSLQSVNFLGCSLDIIPPTYQWTPINTSFLLFPSGEPFKVTFKDDNTFSFVALMITGFMCPYFGDHAECTLCPTGTYTGFFAFSCIRCPPGGFYQDEMGYTGSATRFGNLLCKECPPGRYVHPDKAPGKAITECTSCPQGTHHNKFAMFRACPCQDNFYRLDRFGPCFQCYSDGLICQNESVDLKSGFYWKWESQGSEQLYRKFKEDLRIQSTDYDKELTRFNRSFPEVYACPVASACKGGMESACSHGYEGPLCAVCSKGYYRMISTCQECPSVKWLIGQICLAVVFLLLVILPLMFGKKMRGTSGRSLTDIVVARLKIFISFYQVTSSTFDAFSYVQWPKALLQLGTYAKFLQLNLFQIAPVNCFSNTVNVNIYTSFATSVAVVFTSVVVAVIYYHVKRLYLTKRKSLTAQESKTLVSEAKATCFQYVFLLMFTVFPTTSAQVFQLLPASCHKICVDIQEKSCQSYVRSDYSVECFTDTYSKFAVLAFIMLSFVVGFPLVTLLLLWKNHPKETQDNDNNEIAVGLSFLYENYSSSCWFWEVLELVRKIVLTSVIVLVGGESRTSLGVAAIMSGLYTVLFASYQPISDRFEHWLQLASLLAISANMNVGILLKIPEDNITSGIQTEVEGIGITVILISVNLLVTGMIAGML
ncbi:hypothetical protein ACROYT_G004413 [Oculina patagonica]